MNFPNGFKEKYQHLLGEDAAAFLRPLSKKQYRPFALIPWKKCKKHLMIRFPIPLGAIMERSQENPLSTQRAWSIRKSQQLR